MSKKFIFTVCMLSLVLFLFGCGAGETDNLDKSSDGIDIDLTEMSSSMVYAQVNDLLVNPDDYDGMVIKLEGEFYSQYYDVTDKVYNFIIITDAPACCPQGLEFFNASNSELPEIGETISLVGTFEKYDEGENMYYYIVSDQITII